MLINNAISNANKKVRSRQELASICATLKANGSKIVYCHGDFELIHAGNVRYLETAKLQGDVLLVTVAPDDVAANEFGSPRLDQHLRAEALAALECVDFVGVSDSNDLADFIRVVRPDVYVIDREARCSEASRDGARANEELAALSVGGRIYLAKDASYPSSHLLKPYAEAPSADFIAYLRRLRKNYSASEVIGYLGALEKMNVLVVGDAIIDEYHFCQPFGMVAKSPTIAAQFVRAEAYAGGALAVANHLAEICRNVHLVTCLGEHDSRKEFIKQHLSAHVTPQFFMRDDAPTVIKRRYVQAFLVTKLFEVAFFNDRPLPASVDHACSAYLSDIAAQFDLVIAADFGHGFITSSMINTLCRDARYLAVNTQRNSMNLGYNYVTKYPRADYVCLDEDEMRMAFQDRYGPLESIVGLLADRIDCRMVTVTLGHSGSITYQPGRGFVSAPVFSREVVDTVGAGDAFLSITAPLACMGLPAELIGFVGNAVGALAVRTVGNKRAVDPNALFSLIEGVLG